MIPTVQSLKEGNEEIFEDRVSLLKGVEEELKLFGHVDVEFLDLQAIEAFFNTKKYLCFNGLVMIDWIVDL